MVLSVEYIRKLMGWCPNASAIKTKEALQFVDLPVNAPDRGGKITHVGAGWLNAIMQGIMRAASAFIASALLSNFMYGSINWISSFGIASGFFLGSILIYLLQRDGKKQEM